MDLQQQQHDLLFIAAGELYRRGIHTPRTLANGDALHHAHLENA